jgi:hypothetical protein
LKFGDIIRDDELVIVCGKIEAGEGQDATLISSEVKLLRDAVPANAREVFLTFGGGRRDGQYFENIFDILSKNQGGCEVYLDLVVDGVAVRVRSEPVKIRGSYALETELRSRGCNVEWKL